MSGLSRTPGKRVWVNSPPRVRIPPSPPELESPKKVSRIKDLRFSGFCHLPHGLTTPACPAAGS